MQPERILHAGDTHAQIDHLRYLCERAVKNNCDLILIHGDTEYYPHLESGRRYLVELHVLCEEYNLPVFFLDGNHDNHSALFGSGAEWPIVEGGFWQLDQRLFYIPRGLVWSWGGLRFGAMGGAVSPDRDRRLVWEESLHRHAAIPPGAHWYWWPEEVPSEAEYHRLMYVDQPLDVLLTHDVYEGIEVPNFTFGELGRAHRRALAAIVTATDPALVIHGHLHHWHHTVHEGRTVVGLGANGQGVHSWTILDLTTSKITFASRSSSVGRSSSASSPAVTLPSR